MKTYITDKNETTPIMAICVNFLSIRDRKVVVAISFCARLGLLIKTMKAKKTKKIKNTGETLIVNAPV